MHNTRITRATAALLTLMLVAASIAFASCDAHDHPHEDHTSGETTAHGHQPPHTTPEESTTARPAQTVYDPYTKHPFSATCVSVTPNEDDVFLSTVTVRSSEELSAYCDNYTAEAALLSALSAYDDAFFAEKTLFVVRFTENTEAHDHEVTTVESCTEKDGKIRFRLTIARTVHSAETERTAYQMLIAVSKDTSADMASSVAASLVVKAE